MADMLALETALFDLQADIRVLDLVNERLPSESGWKKYGLPDEDGFDLMRIPCHDSLATARAIQRLQRSIALALASY